MRGKSSIATLVVICALMSFARAGGTYGAPPNNLKEYLNRLVKAYSSVISGYDDEFLILKGGTKYRISDGRTDKTFEELLEKPDIDDMFYLPYPAGTRPKQPPQNFDPGRVRFEPLFVTMYGDCKNNEVVDKLKTIPWLPTHNGGQVAITTVNGVDKALTAMSRELDTLPSATTKDLTK